MGSGRAVGDPVRRLLADARSVPGRTRRVDLYHFGTPIDRPDYARNLHLPAPLRLLILNMNMHRVHHQRPSLPWWALPVQFEANGDRYDAPLIASALVQFSGPIAIPDLRPVK